jgi:hypothetical protein
MVVAVLVAEMSDWGRPVTFPPFAAAASIMPTAG